MEQDNHMTLGPGPFDKRCSHDKTILWCKLNNKECNGDCLVLDDDLSDCPDVVEKCEICGGEL